MRFTTRTLTVLIGASLSTAAFADDALPLTANIGVVSNYMWRGLTQSNNGAAVQGGLDFTHSSGLSAGTWVSNVDFGLDKPSYELDLYGGYKGQVGDFGYNLNTIYYSYPDGHDNNFWELGVSGSWQWLTVGMNYTLDGQAPKGNAYRAGDLYYYTGLALPLTNGFGLGGTLGHYNFDDLGKNGDYTHWQVSVTKDAGNFGTFNLNYDQADSGSNPTVATDKDAKFSVGWKKTF